MTRLTITSRRSCRSHSTKSSTHDVSLQYPEKVKAPRAAWEKWNAEMAPSVPRRQRRG
jgi:hypothetical protein